MPWNEPGNNGKQNDPWGRKEGPPDLDKFFADLFNKLRAFFSFKKSQFPQQRQPAQPSQQNGALAFGAITLALIIIWFLSGLFIVNPAEEAVVLRFGKFYEILQPGLHWFARFIDKKYLVDVQKIYSFSLQGDFLTKSAEQGDLPGSYVETGKKMSGTDQSKNLVNVELNVQYRIKDPRAYLFNVVNPDLTINEVASCALSDMVGQMKLDEVLTTGRENLSTSVLSRIRQVLDPYQTGLEVIAVTLRKVQAPDQVRAAFSDVNRADQDKATFIQQAQAYASKVVPIAQGLAARTLADATGYQQQVVLNAQAAVSKYQALLKVYSGAPEVTRERLYLETMQSILQNTSKVLVDVNSSNNLLYLPLDKILNREITNLSDENAPKLPSLSLDQNDSGNSTQTTSSEVSNDSN